VFNLLECLFQHTNRKDFVRDAPQSSLERLCTVLTPLSKIAPDPVKDSCREWLEELHSSLRVAEDGMWEVQQSVVDAVRAASNGEVQVNCLLDGLSVDMVAAVVEEGATKKIAFRVVDEGRTREMLDVNGDPAGEDGYVSLKSKVLGAGGHHVVRLVIDKDFQTKTEEERSAWVKQEIQQS